MNFMLPETASSAALSPEDQKKRLMVQALMKPVQHSANPGGLEMATGGILSGLQGAMMGQQFAQKPPAFAQPGDATNGGWSTVAQKAPQSFWPFG